MENGLGPAPGSPEKQPGSPSPPSVPESGQGVTKAEGGTPAPASLPGGSKEEEEKAKRLLYCALCKVAVNSLSQLEAHNKGKGPLRPTAISCPQPTLPSLPCLLGSASSKTYSLSPFPPSPLFLSLLLPHSPSPSPRPPCAWEGPKGLQINPTLAPFIHTL